MRKLFLLFIVCMVQANIAQAQFVYLKSEYGFGIGGAQYFGDLNQGQKFNYIRQNAIFFYKKNFNPYVALKATANYAFLGGNDKLNSSVYEQRRNLSFNSHIGELSLSGEFNFFRYAIGESENRFTPYINFGLGAMYYNPYTIYRDQIVYLKPLGTEGQLYDQYKSRRYSNYAMVLPVGMGLKYWMTAGLTFSFEVSNRFTSTDYLDDVSTTYVGANLFPESEPGSSTPDPGRILQDRSVEIGAPIGIAGRQRGTKSTRDQYLLAHATLSIRLKDYTCPNQ
jgi:hypothetical protein